MCFNPVFKSILINICIHPVSEAVLFEACMCCVMIPIIPEDWKIKKYSLIDLLVFIGTGTLAYIWVYYGCLSATTRMATRQINREILEFQSNALLMCYYVR